MKTAGIIILTLGLIGVLIFGIQAVGNSERIHLFGFDIAVVKVNWTPLLMSGGVAIIGLVALLGAGKPTNKSTNENHH